MASGMVKPHKLAGAPEWIFRWRGSRQPLFPRLFAVALAGAALTFLITTVRIRVAAPEKSTPRKASVIYLRDDAQGRALTLRAQEGGPFPSRFELSQWAGLPELEAAALEASRYEPPPYVAVLRNLPPENLVKPLELAAKGERFFPKRVSPALEMTDPGKLKVAPVLYPLSGVTQESLPDDLPPFDSAVDSAMSSEAWRFLVRLNPDGSVAECVSLEKGGETGAAELEAWLRRIQFPSEPAKPFRWIAVGIGFTNQPADGTDAR
ncbi:MAG: hypothetical protein V4584_16470 [Verrucomicrobiota bacterium]